MRWTDDAILLSLHSSGEAGRVVTVFSREYGKWGGFCSASRDKLSVGDICQTTWVSRLSESLGKFIFEPVYSAFQLNFANNTHLLIIQSMGELLGFCLAERDAHPELYDITKRCLINVSIKEYATWELELLKHIGYGLDLSKCAVTGSIEDLYYISPKTGHCVTRSIGEPYKDKLFVIPKFWMSHDNDDVQDVISSLDITGHFLKQICDIDKTLYRNLLCSDIKRNLEVKLKGK